MSKDCTENIVVRNDKYYCDDDGQWWLRNPKGPWKRTRAELYMCEHCKKYFPRVPAEIAVKKRQGSVVLFCSTRCANVHNKGAQGLRGEKAAGWKGGIRRAGGYVSIYMPDHPDAGKDGCVREHRLVMEKIVGRRLIKDETVHHRNGVRDDNRPENLELWSRSHGPGGRVDEIVEWALDFLRKRGYVVEGPAEPLPREFKPYVDAEKEPSDPGEEEKEHWRSDMRYSADDMRRMHVLRRLSGSS